MENKMYFMNFNKKQVDVKIMQLILKQVFKIERKIMQSCNQHGSCTTFQRLQNTLTKFHRLLTREHSRLPCVDWVHNVIGIIFITVKVRTG